MRNLYLSFLAALLVTFNAFGQTTISTVVPTSQTFLSGVCGVTFVIQNTNSYAVTLTSVDMWRNTAQTSASYTLWYSSTSLSGSGTVSSASWTSLTTVSPSNVSVNAVYPIFTGLAFNIPANTTYRFCVVSTNRIDYSSSNTASYSGAGINLQTGNYQISGMNVGYAGSGSTSSISLANNPRYFIGAVTFAPACTAPGSAVASNITSNSATLTWPAVSGSQGYEYVVNTSSTAPSGSGTATSSTSYNASGLTQATNYFIHVRNMCSSTSFSSWVTTPFTTLTSCFPVTAVSVSNLTSSTGVLSWSPGQSSAGYEWVVDQSSGNPSGNGTIAATTTASFSGLTSGATYWGHVRNTCGGGDKSSWTHFQFTMPVCNKPTNMIISNITDSTTDVLWSQMANANGYEYAVNFSSQPPTTGIQSTTGISLHLDDLQPNSKYYIHVRTKCFVADASGWRTDSFVTKMACYAPIVQVNGLGSNTPYAFWDPIPTAIGYEYALTNSSKAPAFGTAIYTPYVGLELPTDGKDYYLHVKSKCNSMFTFSEWSSLALRTGVTGVSVLGDKKVEIFPNPVSDKLIIRDAPVGTTYTVTDVAGRVLIKNTVANSRQEVDASGLSSGVYLLKLNDGLSGQTRFIKQ